MSYYICRRGVPGSAVEINREPNAAEIEVFAQIGFEMASLGDTFRKTCRCPVNGDGYWYTRVELVDASGFCVGSFRPENSIGGEL